MPPLRTLLAFDTAVTGCSVAVWREGKTLAFRREDTPHAQASRLVPMIEAALREAGLDYAALDAIATTVGPGNFTGLRVGLATARGIGLAAGKPVIGLTTLELIAAEAAAPGKKILAVIASGPGHCYAALYDVHGDALRTLKEPTLVAMDALAEFGRDATLIAGPAAAAASKVFPAAELREIRYPDVRLLAAMAAKRGASGAMPAPLYIRPPDAKLPAASPL